ncbi:hypothetical protein [Paenibacillus sp. R14(2021)]|uniref:hypothetical protein n=1 Tax=Paenibacillus sp. R14(2021) TaxID=2859228 RepID=UPI001C6167EC|nr:hypothetical protein [Paenibacillus sp. R14(2021)]
MEQIYPLHEDTIKRYCGMAVCVVTTEGQRHVGILSRCHGGRLMLNERPNAHAQQATIGDQLGKVTNLKSKKQKKGKSAADSKSKDSAAQTQAYYPYDPYYGDPYGGYGYGYGYGYPYYGEALAFDLASIAFLFLLL